MLAMDRPILNCKRILEDGRLQHVNRSLLIMIFYPQSGHKDPDWGSIVSGALLVGALGLLAVGLAQIVGGGRSSSPGHLSRLRTSKNDLERLARALDNLGIFHLEDAFIRSNNRYSSVKADLIAVLEGEYDIGWVREGNDVYMVCDLWGVAQAHDHVALINNISAAYDRVGPSSSPDSPQSANPS